MSTAGIKAAMKVSSSKENHLKAIFHLQQEQGIVTTNAMAAASLAFARSGVAVRVTGNVELPLALDFSRQGHVRA